MTRPEATRPEPRSHRDFWKLLPWYVNGTLEQPERARVEAHLEDCSACHGEVDSLRLLERSVQEAPVEVPEPAGGFQDVLARIDGQPPAGRRLPVWLGLALAGQAAAILVLAAALLLRPAAPPPEGGFRVLSDAAAGRPVEGTSFRVVFREAATQREVRDLLSANGLQIVAGPSPVGAYTVRSLDGDGGAVDAEDLLAAIRGHAAVRLAEPLTPPARP